MPEKLNEQLPVKRLTMPEELKPIFDAAVKKQAEKIEDIKLRNKFIVMFEFKALPSNIFEMRFNKGKNKSFTRKLARVSKEAAELACLRFVIDATEEPAVEDDNDE